MFVDQQTLVSQAGIGIVSSIARGLPSSITRRIIPSMTDDKIRENRLRRAAVRQGLLLSKSRLRDPRAIGFGGWMITDTSSNTVVAGAHPYAYSMSLDGVEKYLTQR